MIQIQSTLLCNLHCKHCYAEAGSKDPGGLGLAPLLNLLEEAGPLGYDYVGLSGGEPLLWPPLTAFLEKATELHFALSIVTNGTLLTPRWAERFRVASCAVAVSVDGPPDEHATVRGASWAFEAMRHGLRYLGEAGVRFTLIFTLTRNNVNRLPWLYGFAEEVGAAGIEVHALAAIGAGAQMMREAVPRSMELQIAAWLLAMLAENRGAGGPVIVLDAVSREVVESSGWPLLTPFPLSGSTLFADLVPALVVETDGTIVPFIHGLPSDLALGRLGESSLRAQAELWRERCGTTVAALVRATLRRVAGDDLIDLFSEVVATMSSRSGP